MIIIIIRYLHRLADREHNMIDEDTIYKYIQSLIFSLYLVFIFLSIQIWFLWNDINKNELKVKSFFNDSFFRKICIYVYSFSVFFIAQGFSDGAALPRAYLKALEILTLTSLVLFTYEWYSHLETYASRKALPQELINIHCLFKKQ